MGSFISKKQDEYENKQQGELIDATRMTVLTTSAAATTSDSPQCSAKKREKDPFVQQDQRDTPDVSLGLEQSNLNRNGGQKRPSRSERRRQRKRLRAAGLLHDDKKNGHGPPDQETSCHARVIPLQLDGQSIVLPGNNNKNSISYIRVVDPYPYTFTTNAKQRWLGRTVLDIFTDEFQSYPQLYYQNAVGTGRITVNDRIVETDYRIRGGDVLRHTVHRHEPAVRVSFPEAPHLRIVADTDNCLVVDKPACLPVHPCGGYHENSLMMMLDNYKKNRPPIPTLFMVHRLDRLTSGLVVLAKSSSVAAEWGEAIQSKDTCQKLYLARVQGRFPCQLPSSLPRLNDARLPVHGEWPREEEDPRRRNAHGWWITDSNDVPARHVTITDLESVSSHHSVEEWLNVLSSAAESTHETSDIDAAMAISKSRTTHDSEATHRPFYWLHVACPTRVVEPKNGVCGCGTFDEVNQALYEKTVKSAQTSFGVVSYHAESDSTLVLCRPQTGRTHQIRLHLQYLGHSIANDPNYGGDIWYYNPQGRAVCQHAQALLHAEDDNRKDGAAVSSSSLVISDEPATVHEMGVCVGVPPRADGEDMDSFLRRTCVWCARNKSGRDDRSTLELLVRSSGIWLHALQYSVLLNNSTKPVVFRTPLPEWSTLANAMSSDNGNDDDTSQVATTTC